jgi:hypothetical protein
MLTTFVNSIRAAFGASPVTGVGQFIAGAQAVTEGDSNMPNVIQEIDMSTYAPETLIARAIEALEGDIPVLNDLVLKGYIAAIDNWRLNKNAGHEGPIPDPPYGYVLKIDRPSFTVAIVPASQPICPKWVEPAPTPAPSKAGVLLPPFAPGRYLTILGDNAPAGHRLVTPDGVLVEKVMTPWFAGYSVEYRKVG